RVSRRASSPAPPSARASATSGRSPPTSPSGERRATVAGARCCRHREEPDQSPRFGLRQRNRSLCRVASPDAEANMLVFRLRAEVTAHPKRAVVLLDERVRPEELDQLEALLHAAPGTEAERRLDVFP